MRRLIWFLSGALAGGVVAVRAMRRTPTPRDIRIATVGTGADLMGLAAKVVRPNEGRHRADAR